MRTGVARHRKTYSLIEPDGSVGFLDVQCHRLMRLASFIKQFLDEERAYASASMFRQQGYVSEADLLIGPDDNDVPDWTIFNQDDATIYRKRLRAVMTLLGAELKPHHVVEHCALKTPRRDLFASGAEIQLVQEGFILSADFANGHRPVVALPRWYEILDHWSGPVRMVTADYCHPANRGQAGI
jgi:hypothetical protein